MGRFAVIAAAVATLTAASGHPGTRTYRDATYGFVVTYPATFHAGVIDLHSAGGPPPFTPVVGLDTRLPVARSSFTPDLAGFLAANFVGNGWPLWVRVWIGPRASRADRDALWKMVRSLRMRRLRPGETTGEARYRVLLPASAYPVVSVTPIGVTLLVHAPNGFYAIVQPPGQAPCSLTFTTDPVAFSCPDGRHWDRVGRALWPEASPFADSLGFAPTLVAGDGHVLVSLTAVTYGGNLADQVEGQVWG